MCTSKDGDLLNWTDLEPFSDVVTCNIGDMLMRWSDDKLVSTLHRVRVPNSEEYQGSRYSIAFFCQANSNVVIQGPDKIYHPITAHDYLHQCMAKNYKH